MDKREHQFDLLKTIAILLVILQHCATMFFKESAAAGEALYSALWIGVPLFVMASGAFQLVPGKYTPEQYYKKRFVRILPAFLLWSTVAYILSAATGKYPEISNAGDAFIQYAPYVILGKVNSAFWFVYMIAGLYLLTPVLQAAFSKGGRPLVEICLIIWGGITVLQDIVPGFMLIRHFPVLGPWLGYYIFGYWARKYLVTKDWMPKAGLAGFLVFFALNAILLSHGHRIETVEALEAVSLFVAVAKYEGCKESKAANAGGRWSYAIYLSHFMVIGLLYAAVPQFRALGAFAPAAALVVVAAVEGVMCYFLEKIDFIPNGLVGITGNKQ